MILANWPRRASEEPHSSTAPNRLVEAYFLPWSGSLSSDLPYWRPPSRDAQYGLSVGVMVSKPVSGQLPYCRPHARNRRVFIRGQYRRRALDLVSTVGLTVFVVGSTLRVYLAKGNCKMLMSPTVRSGALVMLIALLRSPGTTVAVPPPPSVQANPTGADATAGKQL